MTICVAALAEHGKAIVLVADKALTYQGNRFQPAMQAESGGVEKMLPIGNSGWNALFADDPTVAASIISLAAARLKTIPTNTALTYDRIAALMKAAYQEVREQMVADRVLQPRLLTKEDFVARSNALLPLPDTLVLDVVQQIRQFNAGCSLLICGFDEEGEGRVFSVEDPGVISSHEVEGYWAIGVGTDAALARLMWNAAEPEDELDVALYQAFEAKGYSEMIQGVGVMSDVWIMTQERTVPLEARIHNLLVDVFYFNSKLPFKRKGILTDVQEPPTHWEAILRRYVKHLMRPSSKVAGSISPTPPRPQP